MSELRRHRSLVTMFAAIGTRHVFVGTVRPPICGLPCRNTTTAQEFSGGPWSCRSYLLPHPLPLPLPFKAPLNFECASHAMCPRLTDLASLVFVPAVCPLLCLDFTGFTLLLFHSTAVHRSCRLRGVGRGHVLHNLRLYV